MDLADQENKTEMQQAFEEFQETRFYRWCDSLLIGRFHWLVGPITGFVDAFVIVLPTEVVVAIYLMRDRARSLWMHTTIISFCAAIGYLVLALVAAVMGPDILPWMSYVLGDEMTTKVDGILTSYDFLLAITAGATSLFPMPATPFAVLVGLLGAPLGWFVAGVFIGKWIRFGGVAWVARTYGMRAFDLYMKHSAWASLVLLALLVLYFYIK